MSIDIDNDTTPPPGRVMDGVREALKEGCVEALVAGGKRVKYVRCEAEFYDGTSVSFTRDLYSEALDARAGDF